MSIQPYKNIILLIAYLLIAFIHIYYFRHDIAEEKEGDRWVEVKTGDTSNAEWYKISKTATIIDLKAMIQVKLDITIDAQRLIFGGKQLADDCAIQSLQADDPETVRMHLTLELTGGGTFRTRYGAISIYNVLVNMFDEKRCLIVN